MSDTQTSVKVPQDAPSIEDRVAALLPDDETPGEPPAPQDAAPATDELTPSDLPDDAPPVSAPVEELELTYNGEPLKVSKDEAKNLAQLGYHLQKAQERVTGELTAAQQQAQQIAQVVQSIQQTAPHVQQLQAHMQALNMMAASENLNPAAIYQVAQSDPARAQEMQAKLGVYQQQFAQAQQAYQQAWQQMQQQHQSLTAQSLEAEKNLLPRILPQAKDPAKYEQIKTTLMNSLKGLRPQTIQAIDGNAEVFAAFAKAAQYDALQASKRANLQKAGNAPAVIKPGTPSQMDPKVRQSLDLRKEIKRAQNPSEKARAIERYLETKF